MIIGGANYLEKNKTVVDDLNVFPVPDGDTGTNMALTMQSAARQVKKSNANNIEDIAKAASKGSLMGARGNSGVILSQLFRGLAQGLTGIEKANTKDIARAFKMASDTAYKAVMKPIEGTILTVARECAEKAEELAKEENDIKIFLEEVIKHGDETLKKTPEMLDALKQAGVVDAGGKGLLYILIGALKAVTFDDDEFFDELDEYLKADEETKEYTEEADIKFGYCTEFIINSKNGDIEKLKDELTKFGDSMLVIGDEEHIKVHIHTNNPGEVLEKGLKIGELTNIKIDNMRYQHKSKVVDEKHVQQNQEDEMKKYSIITVAMGEGIKNVFKDLRVDYVISGGQTMNPSTEDILKAVENVKGENIIILPNNSNIILAAKQAKELSNRNIEVVPTKTIPQGVTALLSFDEDLDLDENIENMEEAIKEVKTGEVTFAVRDTTINGKEIKKDDVIGISEGEIKSIGNDIREVSMDLLRNIIDEDENDLITIFYGEDISKEKAEELGELLEEEMEECDIEVVYGGQPLYYYIFSVE
ncbi:dihydroxyacetone kinase [Thermohalobacter berrensis]|uniref:Dihydroxyacetone kinase n=2 Tax=Thermohalobacter berrensis TaxID=99594 RepID=A0A419TBD0_9FIRM|nr:dihydroxyacetone kinase [Thermohalobacter berrensis]